MDRLQFFGSIDHGQFVSSADAVIQFFDHTMAAYNLVGQYQDIDVMSSIESPLSMTFKISFKLQDQALSMANKITNNFHNRMELYGKLFNIYPLVNENILDIRILQI